MPLTPAQKQPYIDAIYAELLDVEAAHPNSEKVKALHNALNAGAAALEGDDGVAPGTYHSDSGGGPKGTP